MNGNIKKNVFFLSGWVPCLSSSRKVVLVLLCGLTKMYLKSWSTRCVFQPEGSWCESRRSCAHGQQNFWGSTFQEVRKCPPNQLLCQEYELSQLLGNISHSSLYRLSILLNLALISPSYWKRKRSRIAFEINCTDSVLNLTNERPAMKRRSTQSPWLNSRSMSRVVSAEFWRWTRPHAAELYFCRGTQTPLCQYQTHYL